MVICNSGTKADIPLVPVNIRFRGKADTEQ
jgi:hypothetical protein